MWPTNARIILDISPSEPHLWANMRSKTRNMVKKGDRNEHVFLSGDAERYWNFHAERMAEKGQPSYRVDGQVFCEEDYDGVFIGGAVVEMKCLTAYWVSGSKTSQWLIWKIIQHCKRHGVIAFDLGASRVGSGSYKFKTHLFTEYREVIERASGWKMARGFIRKWFRF